MNEALKGTGAEGTEPKIDWSISVGENGDVGTANDYGKDAAIILVDMNPEAEDAKVVSFGSEPVLVTTASLEDATPDTYTGSLVISIAAE